ncbi:MAG: triosephosphate isomerase, partial [Acidobacteriota bacterium]|nr:triosephosphate isomerase [Acidobacteriota bacterium]
MSARGSRVPLVAGNWKMYKTASEARAYVEELLALAPGIAAASAGAAGAQVAICAPFTALRAVADAAAGSRLAVLAQNMHHEAEGAFTGEVSAPMLLEAGARGVVLGHSERRALFGESDRELALKVPAALREGLLPVLCVGETEEQRTAGEMERTLRHQVTE